MSQLVCIKCPMSCKLSVIKQNDEIIVSGNNCLKGKEFATQEYIAPKRTITSLVKVIGGDKPVLPVKTSAPIPKGEVKIILEKISHIEIQAPVAIGDIVCKNIYEDVDLVATSYTNISNSTNK
jgi:CxxC motif-containing protein